MLDKLKEIKVSYMTLKCDCNKEHGQCESCDRKIGSCYPRDVVALVEALEVAIEFMKRGVDNEGRWFNADNALDRIAAIVGEK